MNCVPIHPGPVLLLGGTLEPRSDEVSNALSQTPRILVWERLIVRLKTLQLSLCPAGGSNSAFSIEKKKSCFVLTLFFLLMSQAIASLIITFLTRNMLIYTTSYEQSSHIFLIAQCPLGQSKQYNQLLLSKAMLTIINGKINQVVKSLDLLEPGRPKFRLRH